MQFLKRWDEELLAASREPARRAEALARCERRRSICMVLAIASAVAASGTTFGSIADPRSIFAGYLALTFVISVQSATATIRLFRMSEGAYRSS